MLRNYSCFLVSFIAIKTSLTNTLKSGIFNQIYYKRYLIILEIKRISKFWRVTENMYIETSFKDIQYQKAD